MRVIAIAAILVVLGTADYFHLGGSGAVGLAAALIVMLLPLLAYVLIFDPSPVFDLLVGAAPLAGMIGVRSLLRESGYREFFLAPLGGTLVLVILSLGLVFLIPGLFPQSGLVLNGLCKAVGGP